MNDQFRLLLKDVPAGNGHEHARQWINATKKALMAEDSPAGMIADDGNEHTYIFNAESLPPAQVEEFRSAARVMPNFVTFEEPTSEIAA